MTQARHHAKQHAQTRSRERRHSVAVEAARLMVEGGIRDLRQAKLKAAERLGILDDAALPRNSEVEEALREYQRLFQHGQEGALLQRREAALRALEFFHAFQPRVVGAVLDGTADNHSPVALHLHAEDPDTVPRFLDQHGIPAEARHRRLRLDRERHDDFPVWLFSAGELAFDITVLPLNVLRQAPLSSVADKPMKRASASQLRQLLTAYGVSGHCQQPDAG